MIDSSYPKENRAADWNGKNEYGELIRRNYT